MGADLIMIHIPMRKDVAPDGANARRVMAELVAKETDEEVLDQLVEFFGVADPEPLAEVVADSFDDPDAALKANIIAAVNIQLTNFEESLREGPYVFWIEVGEYHIWLTGGTSWGDAPSEEYDLWENLLYHDDDIGNPYGPALYDAYGFVRN